jgi:hypothetical protein
VAGWGWEKAICKLIKSTDEFRFEVKGSRFRAQGLEFGAWGRGTWKGLVQGLVQVLRVEGLVQGRGAWKLVTSRGASRMSREASRMRLREASRMTCKVVTSRDASRMSTHCNPLHDIIASIAEYLCVCARTPERDRFRHISILHATQTCLPPPPPPPPPALFRSHIHTHMVSKLKGGGSQTRGKRRTSVGPSVVSNGCVFFGGKDTKAPEQRALPPGYSAPV